jgi:hypothetical protein
VVQSGDGLKGFGPTVEAPRLATEARSVRRRELESTSILQTIAEVAVGLAGFGGIAAGLGYRTGGKWSEQDRVRLLGVVANSLFVILGCFLPYAVHHLGIQPPWFLSGAVLSLAPVWGFWMQWQRVVAHSRAGRVSVQSGYHPSLAVAIALINLVALTLFLAVAGGVARPGGEFGLYLTAVLLLLVNAAVSFLRLLATAFDGDAPAA